MSSIHGVIKRGNEEIIHVINAEHATLTHLSEIYPHRPMTVQ